MTPLPTAPSPPPSQFTVCTSRFVRLRVCLLFYFFSASSKPTRICTALPRCEATSLGVFLLCHFALISPYSNGAVQIRVGLELAEYSGTFLRPGPESPGRLTFRPDGARGRNIKEESTVVHVACCSFLQFAGTCQLKTRQMP